MIYALILSGLCVVVLFARESAHDNRIAAIINSFTAAREQERKEWAAERQILLDRIERPGTVYHHEQPEIVDDGPPNEIELLRRQHEGVDA